MRLKQAEVEAHVKFLFPKAKFIGKGVYKLVYRIDNERVIKINRSRRAGKMEKRAWAKLPPGWVAMTDFVSSRVQIQELATRVGEVPDRVLKDFQASCKLRGVINITKNNVGWIEKGWRVIDCFPVGWSK